MTVVRSQEGHRVQVLSDTICIKLKSIQSPNQMSVVTVEVPPGGFVPPHTHTCEEESYYMLEGSMMMQVGSEEFTIKPDDFVHVTAGTLHGYINHSDQPARFLAWTIGGAIDDFFLEMGEKIRDVPNDLPQMSEILHKYGVEMVAPI
ncbi:MAG TPA: cupin domain-containing protein [Cyanobacteria bacterium UBA11162]|nr:cupin domain-containing protein [Cyanobacteria bacterium UBA12227]HAX90536.1 cupin domain-containing protein [Cyanobacteria bacterium UBA11370]HBL14965.1 cupin domain-containing protein [Cyanobacteria bacterium UBA11162]HBY77953.1 cupin domain-containing protein [Cyanobacteria bacterium UBA11148]